MNLMWSSDDSINLLEYIGDSLPGFEYKWSDRYKWQAFIGCCMSRKTFRESVFERDGHTCNVPWCDKDAVDAHHIWERDLWPDGGYVPENGSSVCEHHHKMSERNEIPPQAHLRWAGIQPDDIVLPDSVSFSSNKWGESFDSPPHGDIRDYHKYPSTRHLLPVYWQSEIGTAEMRTSRDDTGHRSVESFLDIPLVTTIKMDGSNAMLVKDTEEPVRARNGRDAEHVSFDHLKAEYWNRNVYDNLPEHLQVFGENLYAKHSIHYGCPHDGCGGVTSNAQELQGDDESPGCDRRNQGPAVRDVFVVFGVYDTRFDLWLSWPETEAVAEQIGFPTAFVYNQPDLTMDTMRASGLSEEHQFIEKYTAMGDAIVNQGHEGFIVRSMYPFHHGQFGQKLGKYVRPNHVTTDEHWSHGDAYDNQIEPGDMP